MELIFGVITGLIILVFLVVVHELGHAVVAHRNGVGVDEFGVGFPPKAWGKKLKNGVLFTLNWLPLGGFVKLQGEHDAADQPGDYGAATYWQKTKILLAGVGVNWVVAVILLTILAWTGMPKIIPNQFTIPSDTNITTSPVEVAAVDEGTPADKAGLEVGDRLIRVADESVIASTDLSEITQKNKGNEIEIIYERGGVESNTKVTLRDNNDDKKGYLGVAAGQQEKIRTTWSAPIVGVATTYQLTIVTLQGLGDMVSNFFGGLIMQLSNDSAVRETASENISKAGQSVAGPIGILGTIFPQAQKAGATQLVLLTAIISLTLAVMNILPIPALDGGRWFTMTIFRLIKKPLTKEREEVIQATGFMILMSLIIIVTVADVIKLF